MRLTQSKRKGGEKMGMSSRRVRPLFWIIFVFLGGLLGSAMATQYVSRLQDLIDSRDPRLFGLPINPTALTPIEETLLYGSFIFVGALFGLILESITFHKANKTRETWEMMDPSGKIAAILGFVLGLVLTALIVAIVKGPLWLNLILALVLCYIGVVGGLSLKEQVGFVLRGTAAPSKTDHRVSYRPKLLDTNVIIDGRIADICRAGFVEGPIFVPKFILEELQQIADSSDSLKRARGRRGLDILNQMQKEMDLEVPDSSMVDPAEEVDARLVILAREVGGAIITNDFNLNKVAGLQGVDVLNVNELANALKPVVLPGEEMKVTIIKEGKEKEQGIGYLDDGTMIVVEGARRLIGETMQVSVTSVLQTVQGKMIFAKIRENGEQESETVEESIRSYTSGRLRRKTR